MPIKYNAFFDFSQSGLALRAVTGTAEALWRHTVEHFWEFVRAFPNPLTMAEAIVGFVTGFIGILAVAPITAVEDTFVAYAEWTGVHNKLIRMDQAIRMVFLPLKEFVNVVTFSGESSIIGIFLGWLARFIYRTVKNIKLLSRLIRARTEEEFIQIIIDGWKRKLRLFKILGVVLGVCAIFAIGALIVTFFGLALSAGRWLRYPLPQDAKRKYIRGKRQHRINRRAGPDS